MATSPARRIFPILPGLLLLIDLPSFLGMRVIFRQYFPGWFTAFPYWYWGLSILVVLAWYLAMRNWQKLNTPANYRLSFGLMAFTILWFIPKLAFTLIFLVSLALLGPVHWISGSFSQWDGMAAWAGMAAWGVLLVLVLHGIIAGKHLFKTRKIVLVFPELPESFDGFTIAQISDLHLGSFYGRMNPVRKGLQQLQSTGADCIVFTGDLVNNFAAEAEPYLPLLQNLKAPYGKFSILGNHDYGDYIAWQDPESKRNNLQRLEEMHRTAGFRLLKNEAIAINKEGSLIIIAGVENWGSLPFRQYGRLDETMRQVPPGAFTVLLSHDPSHWRTEVLPGAKISLTLSGHTHGMQFGWELGKWKWSPVRWLYREWAGLYRQDAQYLYVNRGFGYIGFPGRVGIWPEITLITLRKH